MLAGSPSALLTMGLGPWGSPGLLITTGLTVGEEGEAVQLLVQDFTVYVPGSQRHRVYVPGDKQRAVYLPGDQGRMVNNGE